MSSYRKFASTRRKKKRGFHGKKAWEINREKRQETLETEGDEGSVHLGESSTTGSQMFEKSNQEKGTKRNVSAEKLKNSSFQEMEEEGGPMTRKKARKLGVGTKVGVSEIHHGVVLQNTELLSKCISAAAICSSCHIRGSKLQLYKDNTRKDGLAEHLFLKCDKCGTITPLETSSRAGGRGGGTYEVNRRSVLASLKSGHSGLKSFCAEMGLSPPVTKKAYNEHLKRIEQAAIENAEEVMIKAANRLRNHCAVKTPEKLHTTENGTVLADVSVSVDGTWQKRGHSSKIGVVFAVSVDTGEILDYVVKSLVCEECKAHEGMDKNSEEYKTWKTSHVPKCQINHNGSSESMEADGAIEIFLRSIEKRGLRYTVFVGDGDSSSYGKVKEAVKHMYHVEKEECVGHIQKRMGTALRKFKKDHKGKLSDGKPVGGKGRLTDKCIDRIQNYYGNAIRNNSGNLENMVNGIWAIYYHSIQGMESLERQHCYCPKGKDTWCKFWQDRQNKTNVYDGSKCLPKVFRDELKPIFTRLSNKELLGRCLKGLTQNQNEAINGQLWSQCPKNIFCGKRRVVIAVCQTVTHFNTGSASKAVLMKSCGIEPGLTTMEAFRAQDRCRIRNAAYKISQKYREQRRNLRAKRKGKADKDSYASGAFDLNSKSHFHKAKTNASTPKCKRNKQNNKQHVAVEVKFVTAEKEVVHIPQMER